MPDVTVAVIDKFHQRTVVTSHLAGATLDNFSGIVARAVANAKSVLRGDALPATDVLVAPDPARGQFMTQNERALLPRSN
ncbi:MAG: hypothetical protein HY848_10060 [Betaproteobacteria bacterium]|nr:hypothetical protein [Betaproteobacteria bacterium]